MKTSLLTTSALVALAACGNGNASYPERDTQHAKLGSLGFEVPSEWHNELTTQPGLDSVTWTPAATSNERKESVVVIRSERSPIISKAGQPALERMLAGAQKSLRNARISTVTPITTGEGLTGARIEVDYVPPGLAATYHRVHVMVLDGSAVINVLYTARDPDPNLEVLDIVLASIRHEET